MIRFPVLLLLVASIPVAAADSSWLLVSASPGGSFKCSAPPVVQGTQIIPELMVDVRKVCRVDGEYPDTASITLTCASPEGLFRLAYSQGGQRRCEQFGRWLAAEASKEANKASRMR